uniref:Uncharacterized protein n=1 Tax=Arundo donax TaxID=35708 RepID=A0A0A9GHI9_ARUDO
MIVFNIKKNLVALLFVCVFLVLIPIIMCISFRFL